ncbi:hypothetical protein BX600DRAFT_375122 [Xylariales sp. PMI_506]|nr:hypothetical protein BX600DRAFT_375122 [Xylariales sp. PMI_506]
MASLLRQIVAGPRARHPEAGLDLCYVTDNIIATSGPSQTYPKRAYRNPLDRLVAFLDSKHGKNWAIWEFRAEGTGYPDHLVYNRIKHYPWPDHHPPPFKLIPLIMASMRDWLDGNEPDEDGAQSQDDKDKKTVGKVLDAWKDKKNPRVIVVHCKAGKGRSGTTACSFLISECGWTPEQALARFTERRMRPKFGPGVSIPSQVRWVGYVDRWTKGGKKYVDRPVEVLEVHVWGLCHGVKLAVEGFVDEGKKIKVFHTFQKSERFVIEGNAPEGGGLMDAIYDMASYVTSPVTSPTTQKNDVGEGDASQGKAAINSGDSTGGSTETKINKPYTKLISPISGNASAQSIPSKEPSRSKSKKEKNGNPMSSSANSSSTSLPNRGSEPEPGGRAVIFKPKDNVRVLTSDVNITLERRNRTPSTVGLTMVTAVAHVWFNAFFEGNGPEQDGIPSDNGVFEIEWDKMDGIKGSSQKGTRAADRIAVVWRFADSDAGEQVIPEPSVDSPVPQMQPADWKGGSGVDPSHEKKLGLRVQSPDSANVSQASSIKGEMLGKDDDADSLKGVKSDLPDGGESDEEASRGRKDGQTSEEAKLAAYAEKLPSPGHE